MRRLLAIVRDYLAAGYRLIAIPWHAGAGAPLP